MKIHKLVVDKIVTTLIAVFCENVYADKAIERVFKENRKWGSRDRRFFAEAVFDCVRFRRRYWSLAGLNDDDYLNPECIDDASIFRLWLVYFIEKTGQTPEWVSKETLQSLATRKKLPFAVEHSFPDWMVDEFKTAYPNDYENIMKALNEPAPIFLRVNEIKSNVSAVVKELANEDIVAEPVGNPPTALKLAERKNVFSTQAFHKGFFEVQDGGSQMISLLLDVKPGMRVVDACAGAGGKSLHIASLMKNKGKIISLDITNRRLKELRGRATRNGVDIIEIKVIDSQKVIKRYEGSFDRVLLDVPCTGAGVVRRNPDTKWKLKKSDLQNLMRTQREILGSYSQMMKKDGKLVYATCSLFPEENQHQVQHFLDSHPDWQLENELYVRPDTSPFDGFYAACLVRK